MNKLNKFINDCNDKIDEKFNELYEKMFKIEKQKEELIEENTGFDKEYQLRSSYNINDLYVGNIENMDYGKANCNLGGLYIFYKTSGLFYVDDGEDLLTRKVPVYKEIFTGLKCYSEESEDILYNSNSYFYDTVIRPNIENILPLKDYMQNRFKNVPENITSLDLITVFDAINCGKINYNYISNSSDAKIKVYKR